jgi:hypothetical protein
MDMIFKEKISNVKINYLKIILNLIQIKETVKKSGTVKKI